MASTTPITPALAAAFVALAMATGLGAWTLVTAFTNATGVNALLAYLACSFAAGIAGLIGQLSIPAERGGSLVAAAKWGWVAVSVGLIWAIIRATLGTL